MKKTLFLVAMLAVLLVGSNAYAFNLSGLDAFGTEVALPVSAPTYISIMGDGLATIGKVDFDVLYNSANSVYTYFYQITNNDSGSGDNIGRFTFLNTLLVPLVGSGVIADDVTTYGLAPVTLDVTTLKVPAANMDPKLAVNLTTERFYYQYMLGPIATTGYLIDGGIGTGKVVGPGAPEPSSMLLLGMGILGLFGVKRKKVVA